MKVLDKLDLEAISTKNFNGIVKTFSLTKPLFVIDKKNEVGGEIGEKHTFCESPAG